MKKKIAVEEPIKKVEVEVIDPKEIEENHEEETKMKPKIDWKKWAIRGGVAGGIGLAIFGGIKAMRDNHERIMDEYLMSQDDDDPEDTKDETEEDETEENSEE